MGPPSYMRSVVDRNVVMRRITVLSIRTADFKEGNSLPSRYFALHCSYTYNIRTVQQSGKFMYTFS
jgi:hypothetical protein